MKPTITILLDKRRSKSEGKYPIKLRVTYKRVQKYYPLGIDLSEGEYSNIRTDKPKKELRENKIKLMEFEAKANRLVASMPNFSFPIFEKKYFEQTKHADDIYPFFEAKIKELKASKRLGTASSYQSTMNSLKEFAPKLGFGDITELFLKDFEAWHLKNENSVTTVGIYIRTLRAIFNDAIAEDVISREYTYPFGKRKYQIPAHRNIKKALSLNEIKLIFEHQPEPFSPEDKALDFWKLSYLCNGMNMKDIAYLKYGNIDDDFIKFRREKTKETSRTEGKTISAYLSDPVKAITQKWGNADTKMENYIFPIINDEVDYEKQRFLIQQFIKQVNKYMKKIATTLKINKPITTYYARHSFATVLKRSGASIEFISESLGHTSVNTTASYLDSFEDDTKKEFAKKLTAFE